MQPNTITHPKAKIPIEDICATAKEFGYRQVDYQENIGLLSFGKDDVRINIYLTKMTVGTCLNHPKQGKTQLFRKHVDLALLKKIFQNPRVHTNKGYK